ncbi:MAG: cytochrome c [Acidobacteriota bacterium]
MSRSKILITLALVLIIALGAWLYWFLALHGFSARDRPSAIEAILATHARRIATPKGAKELVNPLKFSPRAIAEARDHFADHCAICHANNGSGKTDINEGLYPPAPDMRTSRTQSLTDGEIFYIIKNGVRFTGMPGWGGEDEENWKLVLFIRHLPKITAKELDLMKEINGLEAEGEHEH